MSTSLTSFTFFTATTSLNNLPENTAPWAPLPSHSMSVGMRKKFHSLHDPIKKFMIQFYLIPARMGFPTILRFGCRRNNCSCQAAKALGACIPKFRSSMLASRWRYAWSRPRRPDSSCWCSRGSSPLLMEGYQDKFSFQDDEIPCLSLFLPFHLFLGTFTWFVILLHDCCINLLLV